MHTSDPPAGALRDPSGQKPAQNTVRFPCCICGHTFEPDHPKQNYCRLCVASRCRTCCAPVAVGFWYCNTTCRQRARAGARYVILNRDRFTCARCGYEADENIPASLRRLTVYAWSDPPVAGSAITLCKPCHNARVFPDDTLKAWEVSIQHANTFLGLRPDSALRYLSRGEKRRRSRKAR